MSAAGVLLGVSLATWCVSVANVHKSAEAERLSRLVPAAAVAPILDVDRLPERTVDGRTISRSPRHHIENVLKKLHDRGDLPPHPELSFTAIQKVAGFLAEMNEAHLGCYAGLAFLSSRLDLAESTIRLVCEYLADLGFLLNLSRVTADSRKIAGAKLPQTGTRTTVRAIFPITPDMAAQLGEAAILDLIAAGEARPRVELPAGATPPPPPPPPPPPRTPAPRVAQLPVDQRGLVAGADGVPAELRGLAAALEQLHQVAGHLLPLLRVADQAKAAGVADPDHAADAVRYLGGQIQDERTRLAGEGKKPRRLGAAQLEQAVAKCIAGKAKWLALGGEQAKLSGEAAAREAEHEAALSPEQRERRDGTAERRHEPAPRVDPLVKLRFDAEFNGDPEQRRAAQAALDALARQRPPPE